jgi:hypothetical protein
VFNKEALMVRFDISSTDKAVKAELRPGSNICQCADCEAFFTGVGPFDIHLGGTPEKRRCYSPDKMRALGMTQNVNGVWQRGTATGKGTGHKRKDKAA